MSQLDLEKALELAKERLKSTPKKVDKRTLRNPENRFFNFIEENYTLVPAEKNMKMQEVLALLKQIFKDAKIPSKFDIHHIDILKRLDLWARKQGQRLVYKTPRESGFTKCRMIKK